MTVRPVPPPAVAPLSPLAVRQLIAELLQEGSEVSIPVTGSSMSPFLRSGDEVRLRACDATELRLGDVAAYRRGDHGLVLHRVVGRAGGAWLARGDAEAGRPEIVTDGSVLGRVVGLVRDGRQVRLGSGPERRVLAWLSGPGWLRPVLAMPRWLRRVWRGRRVDGGWGTSLSGGASADGGPSGSATSRPPGAKDREAT